MSRAESYFEMFSAPLYDIYKACVDSGFMAMLASLRLINSSFADLRSVHRGIQAVFCGPFLAGTIAAWVVA